MGARRCRRGNIHSPDTANHGQRYPISRRADTCPACGEARANEGLNGKGPPVALGHLAGGVEGTQCFLSLTGTAYTIFHAP